MWLPCHHVCAMLAKGVPTRPWQRDRAARTWTGDAASFEHYDAPHGGICTLAGCRIHASQAASAHPSGMHVLSQFTVPTSSAATQTVSWPSAAMSTLQRASRRFVRLRAAVLARKAPVTGAFPWLKAGSVDDSVGRTAAV